MSSKDINAGLLLAVMIALLAACIATIFWMIR